MVAQGRVKMCLVTGEGWVKVSLVTGEGWIKVCLVTGEGWVKVWLVTGEGCIFSEWKSLGVHPLVQPYTLSLLAAIKCA